MIYVDKNGNLIILNINDFKNDKNFYEYIVKIK